MKTTFDPAKRDWTLAHRGLDFAVGAEKVFSGQTVTMTDERFNYAEVRRPSRWPDGCNRLDSTRHQPSYHFNEVLP